MPGSTPLSAAPCRAHADRMHIRDWPETERPREKLLARGAGSLSDAELLALFLGSGTAGRDAVSGARDLLAQQAGLRPLLDREPKALTRLHGIGPARACLLAAALELGHRHLAAQLERGDALGDPDAAGRIKGMAEIEIGRAHV